MEVPFDSDFDSPRRVGGLLTGVALKGAFFFGAVVGVLIMSVVGGLFLLVR